MDSVAKVDTTSTAEYDSVLQGYDISAIVVCCIIVSAIGMCYLTWKFRYKIMLRTVRNNFIGFLENYFKDAGLY